MTWRAGLSHRRLSPVARVASSGGGRRTRAGCVPSWSVLSCHFFRLTGATLFTKHFRLVFISLVPPCTQAGGQEDGCCLPFVGQRLHWDTACVPAALRLVTAQPTWGGGKARPASQSSQSTFDPNASTVACERARLYRGVEGTSSCPCSHASQRCSGGLGFFSFVSLEESPLPGTRAAGERGPLHSSPEPRGARCRPCRH